MPRFFFHIRDGGTLLRDEAGGEFDSLSEAHHEAVKLARCAVSDMHDVGDTACEQAVEVCDDQGAVLEVVNFADAHPSPSSGGELDRQA